MYLYRLIYCSSPALSGDTIADSLRQIHVTSRENNQSRGITSALILNRKRFLHVLEGGRPVLTQAFTHIVKDKRHTGATLLDVSPITERMFAGWPMALAGGGAETTELIRRFSTSSEFSPEEMAIDSIVAFLRALSKTGRFSTQSAPYKVQATAA